MKSNKIIPSENVPCKRKATPKKEDISALSLIGTSLKHQTKEFFNKSSLHGVRYIAEQDRPFCERFMWLGFTTIGTIATCIIIVSLWEKFQTNPTITGLDTDFHNWDVPFPAVTVCETDPIDEDLLREFLLRTWGEDIPSEAELLMKWLSTLSYTSLAEYYAQFINDETDLDAIGDVRTAVFNVVTRCESLFMDCLWKGESEVCCEGLIPTFTELGFCYAFNSRHAETTWPWQTEERESFQEEFIHETDAKWSFAFNSFKNDTLMDVYILSSEEMVGVGTSPQHSWDRQVEKVSFSVKQTYTTEDARQLTIKQRRCVFSDEIKLDTSPTYTYSACMRQCRMKRANSICGCVPHFYPRIEGYRWCSLRELACIANNAVDITEMSKCNCELGCSHTVYEVEKLTEVDTSKSDDFFQPLEMEFVSWPMVRYKREVLFGWVDLLVSFGGIAGLFLGFSLLSGVEIIYYFSLRACCAACCTNRDELIEEKLKKKEKPPFDLSLTPWFKSPPLPHNKVIMDQPTMINVRPVPLKSLEMAPPQYSPPPLYQYLP